MDNLESSESGFGHDDALPLRRRTPVLTERGLAMHPIQSSEVVQAKPEFSAASGKTQFGTLAEQYIYCNNTACLKFWKFAFTS